MIFAAKASLRTFPATDPWAEMIIGHRYSLHGEMAIANHVQQQRKTNNTYWTSSFNTNCSEPDHWSEVYPDVQWKNFRNRCTALVEITARYLRGEEPNWCRNYWGEPANPRYWGSEKDLHRVEKETWEEIFCDEPSANCLSTDRKDPNNKVCAKNYWFREYRRQNVR